MFHYYSYIALDIANERAREARDARMAHAAALGHMTRPSMIRRGLVQGLAAVSRGTAAAARRLDTVAGDDRGHSLATR